MENQVSSIRYWNYVATPFVIFLAFFGTYTISTLKRIQTMNPRLLSEQIREFRRNS
jgi:hypothetical protein